MNVLISTIDTLHDHVIRITVGFIAHVTESFSVTTPLKSEYDIVLEEDEGVSEVETSFKKIDSLLREASEVEIDTATPKNVVMYTAGVDVPVYAQPTIEFDSRIGTIPYGEMVMMLETRGRFHYIVRDTQKGWVLRDDLVDRASRVHPEFTIGQENSVDEANTAQVRSMIHDEFGIGRSEFPLQAGEYVTYRLWKKGIRVAWPDTRPRVPGVWQKILRGVPGIHMGVVPKVGSIMEYLFEDDTGHLAYVDAVFPDDTITVSEVNYPDSGIYNERVLTKEEWKELKPVFIKVQ